MHKPSRFVLALVTPGVWLVRCRFRLLARCYFALIAPLALLANERTH